MTAFKTRFYGSDRKLGDPSPEYESMLTLWRRNKSIVEGEAHSKAFDEYIDTIEYKNLLVPFSPKMNQAQYNFYKAEAELPGFIAQYVNILTSGLLRKPPIVEFDTNVSEEADEWLFKDFTADGGSLIGFLYDVLREELTTNRGWISVDLTSTTVSSEDLLKKTKPYPILWNAEQVINWRVGVHPLTGMHQLLRITIRYVDLEYDFNSGHGVPIERLLDYRINDAGNCEAGKFKRNNNVGQKVMGGRRLENNDEGKVAWYEDKPYEELLVQGKTLNFIPVFPTNGSADIMQPILQPLIDREVALYNKVSRRNHLLLGAGTYTPYICSDMSEDDFYKIVDAGLGSWLKLEKDDNVGVLEPPTAALSEYDRSITATVDEMTRMGIRILAPDTSESGVALELRNASQSAQLNALNTRVSETMEKVISLMVIWRYGGDPNKRVVNFKLSEDFNPAPIGSEWLRLVTEWYQSRIIPRSAFINMAKRNDLLPEEYDDDAALEEIEQDSLVPGPEEQYNTNTSTYLGE